MAKIESFEVPHADERMKNIDSSIEIENGRYTLVLRIKIDECYKEVKPKKKDGKSKNMLLATSRGPFAFLIHRRMFWVNVNVFTPLDSLKTYTRGLVELIHMKKESKKGKGIKYADRVEGDANGPE